MNSDTMKGQWKQLVGHAKQTWSKLTDDELLKLEGDAQRLSGLIQERYGIARDQADSQIQKFIDRMASDKSSAAATRRKVG